MIRNRAIGLLGFMRRSLVTLIVLAFFVFPAVVGFSWVSGVIASRDSRIIYKSSEFNVDCSDVKSNNQDVEPFSEPLITVTFDDGWESTYSNALPIMESLCISSTHYILGDHFADRKYLSVDQVLSFQEFGHEVGSHTMTHPNLTTLSKDNLFFELNQSKVLLSEKFGDIKDFASPLGAYNDEVISQIKSNYRSHRNTAGDPETVGEEDVNLLGNFDRYNIVAYTVRRSTPDEYIVNLLNFAKANNGWVVLVYHQIDQSDSEYAVTPEVFERQMKIIKDSGVKAPTMGDALDIIDVEGTN